MTTHLVDLTQRRVAAEADADELGAYLAQLLGEAFRFARVSYGNELTLHLGELRPGRSARSPGPYGTYVLGLRASPWLLKSASQAAVLMAEPTEAERARATAGRRLDADELERGTFVTPGSRVVSALPISLAGVDGFGLELRLSDGSALVAFPDRTGTAADAENADLPEIADWEVLGPHGLLSAWPGRRWTFEPRGPRPSQTGSLSPS